MFRDIKKKTVKVKIKLFFIFPTLLSFILGTDSKVLQVSLFYYSCISRLNFVIIISHNFAIVYDTIRITWKGTYFADTRTI